MLLFLYQGLGVKVFVLHFLFTMKIAWMIGFLSPSNFKNNFSVFCLFVV